MGEWWAWKEGVSGFTGRSRLWMKRADFRRRLSAQGQPDCFLDQSPEIWGLGLVFYLLAITLAGPPKTPIVEESPSMSNFNSANIANLEYM